METARVYSNVEGARKTVRYIFSMYEILNGIIDTLIKKDVPVFKIVIVLVKFTTLSQHELLSIIIIIIIIIITTTTTIIIIIIIIIIAIITSIYFIHISNYDK